MVASAFYLIHLLFDSHLATWAAQIHVIALCLLAFMWFWPLIGMLYSRIPKSTPDVEWVQLWRCPACNTYNRKATMTCTHCEYHLKAGPWARWVPLWLSEGSKRHGRRLRRAYQTLGWVLFYGVTALAVWGLGLYTFQMEPMRELLASFVLILLLLPLMAFRHAFRPALKSPIRALFDIVSGLILTGVMLFSLYLWAQKAQQKELSAWLELAYKISVGRWHIPESTPFAGGAPIYHPSAQNASPQKAAPRRP